MSRMSLSTGVVGLLPLLVLVACGPVYDVSFVGGDITDVETSSFRYSGADRDFATTIIGNPFPGAKPATDRALIKAMQGRDMGLNTNFTTTPRNANLPFRIVMAFNPGPGFTAGRLCGDPAKLRSLGKQPRLHLVAGFCHGQELMFAMASSMPAPPSPDHKEFGNMVGQLMYVFVPYHSMTDDPDDDDD